MTNLEKKDYFDSLHSKETNKVIINQLGNQSVRIVLQCGCTQIQNYFSGKPNSKEAHPHYAEHESLRFQFFEFCKKHK